MMRDQLPAAKTKSAALPTHTRWVRVGAFLVGALIDITTVPLLLGYRVPDQLAFQLLTLLVFATAFKVGATEIIAQTQWLGLRPARYHVYVGDDPITGKPLSPRWTICLAVLVCAGTFFLQCNPPSKVTGLAFLAS